jgi:hypothetical protein
MCAVIYPGAARPDELAGRNHRSLAENRDLVPLPAGIDTQDAEAGLLVVVGDALDQTGQNLGWRALPGCCTIAEG